MGTQTATSEETRTLTAAEKASLTEMFLRGIKEIGMPETVTAESLIPVLRAGLNASHAFAAEMMEARTERSQLAREVLTSEVYGRCVMAATRQRLLDRLDDRARARGVASARLAMFNEVLS